MKNKLYILTFFLLSFCLMMKVDARSFSTAFVGNSEFSDDVKLYVQVNNITDFNGACAGLCGFVGTLNYDSSKINLTSISALNGFDLTQGSQIVLYKVTGVSNGTNILQLSFKNVGLKNGESTTISFNDITASDGDNDIISSNIAKSIKFVTVNNNSNTNTNNSNNSSTNTNNNNASTVPQEEAKKSSNNFLSSITLSYGNIEFDKDILKYDVVVDSKVNEIKISSIAEDSKSSITGNDSYVLSDESNIIKLIVKAEDGSERTYEINVLKEEENVTNGLDSANEKENSKLFSIKSIIINILCLIFGSLLTVIVLCVKNKKRKKQKTA